MRGSNESTIMFGTAEDDVARFVAHQQGACDLRMFGFAHVHHAHAIRQVVNHPYFIIGAGHDSDGFQTHGD